MSLIKSCNQGFPDLTYPVLLLLIPMTSLSTRAAAYFDKQDIASAISDLNTAVTLDPKHAIAYTNLGHAHFQAGK